MPINAFELPELEGEYIDGPSHLESEVDLELSQLGDRVVLTLTATHPAAPDRSVRTELHPGEAMQLYRQLGRLLED